MRSMRTLLFAVLLVALAACGGGPASSTTESTGGEPSTPASVPAGETPAASTDNGGPGATDVDGLIDALVPPNSTQVSRTDVPQGSVVAYTSSDSTGDLRDYYVRKIAELNLNVITTTNAANTYAVAFATNQDGTGLGGSVAISNQGDVTNVLVTVAEGS